LTIDPDISPWEAWLRKWFCWLLAPAILVNAGGLFVAILEPDGALYATIAKTISQTGDFINLRVDGRDWLDKPHFPFWMAAWSFRIFGISGFAYKLPALLCWGAGAWYTYRLAHAIYNRPVARLATLIYVSAAHLVISNNDVRAEPYLTGLIIGSVYHFYRASRSGPFWHLLAGSLLAACAVMTKGPFVGITIGGGLLTDWIMTRDWQQFRSGRWWIALALTGLFILPELYCLWQQFDLHPEKQVFGRTGVSGIRFFFWDSQFGRFFNTGPIKGSGDPFFYLHTLLWAFLPWSLLLYAAIIRRFRSWKKDRILPGTALCAGASILTFIVFSLSRFQLPHYLNILFPFFSILTAAWITGLSRQKSRKIAGMVQNGIALLLPALLLFLCWILHFRHWLFTLVAVAVLSAAIFVIFRGSDLPGAFARSFCAALLAFAFVNFYLYPALLEYQAGTVAGKYVNRLPEVYNRGIPAAAQDVLPAGEGLHPQVVYMLRDAPVNYSFEFYCRIPVRRVSTDSLGSVMKGGETLFFLPSDSLSGLSGNGYKVQRLKEFPDFHVSQLTGQFLYYRTRQNVLNWYSLARVFK
jgi:4-amino-4-deoxy-L-arabinose transferase-like glycosyltransferase